MLRRRRHINGEMTPEKREMTPERRDMRKELLDWKEAKSSRASRAVTCLTPTKGTTRSNENTPHSMPRSSNKVVDENQIPWHHISSPLLTPAKRRGHVNAVSPLMEVCQNVARSSGEVRFCRPSGITSPLSLAHEQASVMTSQRSRLCEDAQAEIEIAVWEESVQVPCTPPPSPLTPLALLLGRREAYEHCSLQGFLQSLPESIYVSFPDEASPERRRLLTCLDQSEEAVEEDHIESLPSSPEQLLEDDEEEELRLGSFDEVLRAVQRHDVVWPAQQTALDIEDYLSRAPDIETFCFIELRDRVSQRVENERMPAVPLETIEEYPPNMPQWQIESIRSRSAMRERRRSTSQKRRRNTEEALDCTVTLGARALS